MPVIVAWSPYGKSQRTAPSVIGLLAMIGLDSSKVSGLEKFEGPDPAYWCAQGYAICNPDPRGIAESEGDSAMFGRQEGADCYDLIEWLASHDWCSGKVAMSGTSYLTVAQWITAAEQPPHLAAINCARPHPGPQADRGEVEPSAADPATPRPRCRRWARLTSMPCPPS